MLISKLKRGDRATFKQFVEAHKDQVYNTTIGFLHNLEDAEDVTQEVFMEVYNSIDSFNENANLSTWVYRIAVNKSLELIRHRKRQKRFGFFKALMNSNDDINEIQDSSSLGHPGVDLENKERANVLLTAIGRLPKNQNIAFTLSKVEGLKTKEIADIMQKSSASVEALIHRAKENLKVDLYAFYNSQKD
tara:strand:+ start:15041 stop:15610 length:570 start_codon:yes stop_codon:yes gene_type:complete